MSDTEFNHDIDATSSKAPARGGRACDSCRMRKIRCNGDETSTTKCTRCNTNNLECTYLNTAPKRGYSKRVLTEKRTTKMEEYLKTYMGVDNFEKEFGSTLGAFAPDTVDFSGPFKLKGDTSPLSFLVKTIHDDRVDELDNAFALLSTSSGSRRGFGKSSRALLVQEAWTARHGTDKRTQEPSSSVPELSSVDYPWENQAPVYDSHSRAVYDFPPPDLLASLIDLYFEHYNTFLPLLHRPTFNTQMDIGLHLTDPVFGANVMMMCALGSSFSDDPRVFMTEYNSTHTCGWKWFRQVDLLRPTILRNAGLFDLQFFCLASTFLTGSNNANACWLLVGIGIRLAQDAGADRKTGRPPTAVDELWKRAWWILIILDRFMAESLGRAAAVNDDEMTQILPIDCDDEYWENEDPALAFVQPEGKPSKISAFIHMIGLLRLLGFALRTLYSINRYRLPPIHRLGVKKFNTNVVTELDSALNTWLDRLPAHLQVGNQDQQPEIFFRQSTAIHTIYYSILITIHRPFVDLTQKESPMLDMCTNAARSCVRMLHRHGQRVPDHYAWHHSPAFMSGVILLLSVWHKRQSGKSDNFRREMEDVQKCIHFLNGCSDRSPVATRFATHLQDLAAGSRGEKRPRDESDDVPTSNHRSYHTELFAPSSTTFPPPMGFSALFAEQPSAMQPIDPYESQLELPLDFNAMFGTLPQHSPGFDAGQQNPGQLDMLSHQWMAQALNTESWDNPPQQQVPHTATDWANLSSNAMQTFFPHFS